MRQEGGLYIKKKGVICANPREIKGYSPFLFSFAVDKVFLASPL